MAVIFCGLWLARIAHFVYNEDVLLKVAWVVAKGVSVRAEGEIMFGSKQEFLERQKQWRLFDAWKVTNPDLWPDGGIDDKWKWFCEAWEMACRWNPDWIRPEIDMEKVERLKKIAGALAGLEARNEKPQSGPEGNNASP